MITNINKEKLEALLVHFYHATGLVVSVRDRHLEQVCITPRPLGAFCRRVWEYPALRRRCAQCDRDALTQCRERGETYAYRCHMGLLEVATPIKHEGEIIGFLLFGQINDGEGAAEIRCRAEAAAREVGADPERFTSLISDIHCGSAAWIAAVSEIAKMAAAYIWLENLLSLQREGPAARLEAYIREHIGGDLEVGTLCRVFHVSATALYRLCREQFGCSPSHLVQKHRLTAAKIALREGATVAEAATRCGFSDPNYFVRFFKRHTGKTPGRAYK